MIQDLSAPDKQRICLFYQFIQRKCAIKICLHTKKKTVFMPEISVLGPRGLYPPKSGGHMKKSGDSTINDQDFIEKVPVGFRCGYFAPCNLFL